MCRSPYEAAGQTRARTARWNKRTSEPRALPDDQVPEAAYDKVSVTWPASRKVENNLEGPTDGQLMTSVRGGDAAAYRVIVERHSVALYRIAYRLMGRASEAEDVVQDVLVKVWSNPTAWRPGQGADFAAWLRRVTTNRCLDGLRRRAFVSDTAVPEQIDPTASAETTVDSGRLAQHATEAIAALPDRQRAAVVLTYYEELSNAAAARTLGMSVDGFESLLVRARRALRQDLEGRGLSSDDLGARR